MSLSADVRAAYDTAAASWEKGPSRIYDRLAAALLDESPVDLRGRLVLDLGAGTGAAGRVATARGATVLAVDASVGMLTEDSAARPPAAVGDALDLPFATGAFDAVVAAFSLNHLPDPVAGLSEARRVVVSGGSILVSAYGQEGPHPVKEAVEGAATALGWIGDEWYRDVAERAVPRLATPERASETAIAAGLVEVAARQVAVPFPDLTSDDLVSWRLGMPQLAPFVASLSEGMRADLKADALRRLATKSVTLERRVILLSARAPEVGR